MIKYYFTTFGDIYAGFEFQEMNFPDFKIIVQADKLKDYTALSDSEKTLEKIKEFANVCPLSAFVEEVEASKISKRPRLENDNGWKSDYDRKNMFVFGAGASAYCVNENRQAEFEKDELRPPLGNGLFSRKFKKFYDKYDGVKLSLYDLQHDKANVEEYLEEEWKEVQESGNQAVMSRHINIQFYLQELLMEISKRVSKEYYDSNLYAKLADKLQKINARNRKMHFAFVSFNQDTILESFLSKYFKRPLSDLDEYVEVNDSPFCVFKPHGSWNWGWQFPNKVGNRQKNLFDDDVNFHELYYKYLGKPIDMVGWGDWGLELMLNVHRKGKLTIDKSRIALFDESDLGNFYPAILLPYRDKDEFTMSPKHICQLNHYFSYVEKLFVIGWKGNEALFNNILKNNANKIRRVIIVDPDHKTVEENLREILNKPGVTKIIYNDFEDFIKNGLDKELK